MGGGGGVRGAFNELRPRWLGNMAPEVAGSSAGGGVEGLFSAATCGANAAFAQTHVSTLKRSGCEKHPLKVLDTHSHTDTHTSTHAHTPPSSYNSLSPNAETRRHSALMLQHR